MVKKVFQVGDLVFAKVRGYPAWPARITGKASGGKYAVFFYGTWEVGNMKPVEMWPYIEKFRQRFGPANMHKKWYSEGLYQIEHTPEIAFQQVGGEGDVQRDASFQEDGDEAKQVTKTVLIKDFSIGDLKEVQVKVEDLHGDCDFAATCTKVACEGDVVRKMIMAEDKIKVEVIGREMVEQGKKALKESILSGKKEKLKLLKTEKKLVVLICMIQKVMSIPVPDLAECVELLEKLERVKIEPLMVMKLPDIFYTVRKLSSEWRGGSGDSLAEEVRERSGRVRVKIVEMFDLNTANSLDEISQHFEKKVTEFKDLTCGLSEMDMLRLTCLDDI